MRKTWAKALQSVWIVTEALPVIAQEGRAFDGCSRSRSHNPTRSRYDCVIFLLSIGKNASFMTRIPQKASCQEPDWQMSCNPDFSTPARAVTGTVDPCCRTLWRAGLDRSAIVNIRSVTFNSSDTSLSRHRAHAPCVTSFDKALSGPARSAFPAPEYRADYGSALFQGQPQ